jgi:hypothetical protein
VSEQRLRTNSQEEEDEEEKTKRAKKTRFWARCRRWRLRDGHAPPTHSLGKTVAGSTGGEDVVRAHCARRVRKGMSAENVRLDSVVCGDGRTGQIFRRCRIRCESWTNQYLNASSVYQALESRHNIKGESLALATYLQRRCHTVASLRAASPEGRPIWCGELSQTAQTWRLTLSKGCALIAAKRCCGCCAGVATAGCKSCEQLQGRGGRMAEVEAKVVGGEVWVAAGVEGEGEEVVGEEVWFGPSRAARLMMSQKGRGSTVGRKLHLKPIFTFNFCCICDRSYRTCCGVRRAAATHHHEPRGQGHW